MHTTSLIVFSAAAVKSVSNADDADVRTNSPASLDLAHAVGDAVSRSAMEALAVIIDLFISRICFMTMVDCFVEKLPAVFLSREDCLYTESNFSAIITSGCRFQANFKLN